MVVHGVPVGGLTPEEAEEALAARFQPELAALRIRYALEDEQAAERGYGDFGARFDFGEVVAEARLYSRPRNLRRSVTQLMGRPHEINKSPIFRFDPARVEEEIREIADKLHRPPINARLAQENGRIIVLPETHGRAVNTAEAAEATISLLSQLGEGTVELTARVLPPRYTQKDLNFTVSPLGEYTTPHSGDFDDPRIRNIQKAANRIHNRVLFPGDVFSAGTVIGAYLPDSGYEAALVLINGEPADDIGGGVCQVATTLYNAVLRAELTVVQRHNHSVRVSYTDYGFDATLAGDWFDLKFRNDTPHPVLITADMSGGSLRIALHGFETRPSGRTVRFTSERVNVTSPQPYKEVADDGLAPGERVIMLEAVLGYTYEVFKHIYMNGNETERVRVNTSTYRPLQGVIHVGVER
jgi:vancomycin resistance protein YoaR